MKTILSILTGLALIAVGYFGVKALKPLTEKKWEPSEVYALWIKGVEISPSMPDGCPWNDDGTAPNLVATLSWRNTLLLETPEASHTLIARWDRTSLRLKEFLKTQLSPNALENVARIHGESGELVAVEVKDRGLISSRWIGGLAIPCGVLRPGENEIIPNNPGCSIRSLTLMVVPSSVLENNGQVPRDSYHVTEGIAVMDPPPPDQSGDFKNSTVGKGLRAGIKVLSGLLNKASTNP